MRTSRAGSQSSSTLGSLFGCRKGYPGAGVIGTSHWNYSVWVEMGQEKDVDGWDQGSLG